ncbi:MAG: isochorismatase family protein, partial [Planctomycetota bacterium]|nr:isochorismatase family protein [Planctomycetota bacterium]
ALDLLANDYLVYVVADATSSHTTQDHKTAIERLSKQGATITTTEALIFELTATAQAPAFKQVLDVVKDRRNALSKQ